MWEIKKLIVGGKKAAQENTSILNPKTGKLAVSKKEIRQVTLTYCKETLTNNEPEEGFEDEINRKKEFVRDLLKIEGGSFKASKDTFKKMVDKFKRSNKQNYDFLTKAGEVFLSWPAPRCSRSAASPATDRRRWCL